MIKRVLNGQFLNTQTENITKASFILGAAYLLSGVLGLVRDGLLAGRFGAGSDLDVYYAAFRIPDFISMVLIMGSISAAIIPIFSEYLVRSKEEAWKFFSNLLNLFLFSLIIICLILIVFTPQLISLIVPGFSAAQKETAVFLTRIMFLSPILLGISNVISGVLLVFKRFLVTSLSPILYNLGIIIGILFFVPKLGVKGLGWGVVLGGALHLLIQLPVLFSLGFKVNRIFNFSEPGFLKTIKLTIPRAFGLAVSQINLIAVTVIGSTLAAGSIAVFNFANNFQGLPITFIAVSFSTAAFPFLAQYYSQKNREKLVEEFSNVFRQILFLIIPLSVLIFVLRAQIVRIILGRGKFGWFDTRLTAACLGVFALSIFAYGLSLLISKTFYAFQNTKIPAIISSFCVFLNIGLSILFVWLSSFENIFRIYVVDFLDLGGLKDISVVGLPLAFSLSGIVQFILLLFFLYKKIGDFKSKEIFDFFIRIFLAGLLMGIASYITLYYISGFVNMQTFIGLFIQAGSAGFLGIIVYILFSLLIDLKDLRTITFSIFKKFRRNGQ
ncbi:MAG: murein biosynthesis integral membrane protein MurJ [Candidatus Pacebacteria bacterium]|nr:murein biosynthesis integral membrane protein MurJ [Candidatus Paceibacterota bacterium]